MHRLSKTHRAPAIVVLLALIGAPIEAIAEHPHPNLPDNPTRDFDASVWIDLGITLGAGGGWIGLHRAESRLIDPSCPCAREQVNRLDRPAIDWAFSAGEPLAHLAVAASILTPLVALWRVTPRMDDFLSDALLVLQSAALAGLAAQGVKIATGRPYPYMYRDPADAQVGGGINYASFFSAHTAVPMAASITAAYRYHKRQPRSRWRWVIWIAGPALAIGAGALQMSAGNHFLSDVTVGAAFGVGVGLLNPLVHDWLSEDL